MMYKIAVLGGDLLTIGFELAGVTEVHTISKSTEAEAAIRELMQREDIGLIAISSSVFKSIRDEKLKETLENSTLPVVVLVPEYGEEEGEDTLRRLIIEAVGIDLEGASAGKAGRGK